MRRDKNRQPARRVRAPTQPGATAPTVADLDAKLNNVMNEIQMLWQNFEVLWGMLHRDANGNVELSAPGTITLVANSDITLESGTRVKARSLGGSSLEILSTTVNVSASNQVHLESSLVKVNSPTLKHEGALLDCTGNIKCIQITADSVAGTSYTPGAGNVW